MDIGQIETGAGAPEDAFAGPRLSPGKLADWVHQAQPGARLIYNRGLHAGGEERAINALLQAYEARGMLYLVQRRRCGVEALDLPGFDYLAVRSSRPSLPDKEIKPKRIPSVAAQAETLFANNGRRAAR